MISRVFPKNVSADSHNFHFQSFHAIHIQNLSNWCWHKVCPVNFTSFLNLIFSVFCSTWSNIEGTAWFVKHQAIIWGLLHSICMFQVINPNRAVGNGDGSVPPPIFVWNLNHGGLLALTLFQSWGIYFAPFPPPPPNIQTYQRSSIARTLSCSK